MALTIEQLQGRMLDADSHLQLPPHKLDEALGADFAGRLRAFWAQSQPNRGGARAASIASRYTAIEPDAENVWTVKMWRAPGAFDADVRLRTLDCMGIDRQLLFPMAVPAVMMLGEHPQARQVARHHNDYVLDWAADAGGRLRPVAVLNMFDRDAALEEARRVIDRGALAINISCGRPPAGLSPADPAWEPLWSMLEEAGVPVVLHIGGEVGFMDKAWGATPNLLPGHQPDDPLDGETVGPFSLAMMSFAPQAFLTALILDGVLERHPNLHIGVIEMTAQWVGALAEMLDQRYELFKRVRSILSMKPSEYLNRHVRVTPFWWEPVGTYIERYGLEDVYVFSTDFPHVEGGTDPVQRFHASLAGHSDEVFEKFFVTNSQLIL